MIIIFYFNEITYF